MLSRKSNFSLLFSTVLACACLMFGCQTSESSSGTVTNESVIIDVRSTEEFDNDHVKEAVHIPYQNIAEHISKQVPEKDQQIFLYCRSGHRAGIALKTLKQLGYSHVENCGGIDDMRAKLARKRKEK